jgi:hypothetical protein
MKMTKTSISLSINSWMGMAMKLLVFLVSLICREFCFFYEFLEVG